MEQENMLVESRLDTLSQGRVLERANAKLREAIEHCLAYPDLAKPREVIIRLRLRPDADEDGDGVRVPVKSDFEVKLPSQGGPADVVFARAGQMRVMTKPFGEEAQTELSEFMAKRQAGTPGGGVI